MTTATLHCRRCDTTHVSDRTPMASDGYCMMCRPFIPVTCDRCSAPCQGAYDGQRKCPPCRSVPLSVLAEAVLSAARMRHPPAHTTPREATA
jgi:hypothetical protein